MKTLLVTGASGFLGWNLCAAARAGWRVVGTAHSHHAPIPGVEIVDVDLRDAAETGRVVRRVRPDAVVHAAAVADPNQCQRDAQGSRAINVDASLRLADLCRAAGIPCALASTDLVFDGLHAPYAEADPVSPVSEYGRQKVEAESGMLDRWEGTVVCRLPLMFGKPGPSSKSFIQPMIAAINEGRELRLFVDEFRTPVSAACAAGGILLALASVRGLVHLGGRERVSRYEFGKLLAATLGRDAGLVPLRQCEMPMQAPRPPDVSLDSSKAFALGYDPPPLLAQLSSALA